MSAPLAVGALVVNALVWGLSWWPSRWLDGLGVHGIWTTFGIYLGATLVVLAWRPGALAKVFAHPGLWALAAAAGTTNVCFTWAVNVGEVVRVVLLFYLMPVWSMLFARWLLGERQRPAALLRTALALAGALVVLWPGDGSLPWPRDAADWLAVAGGAAFALNNVLLRRYGSTDGSARALAMFLGGVVVGGGVGLLLGAAGSVPWPPAALAATWVPALAALSLVFLGSNMALQYGAARLTAAVTAVVMLTEVLFAALSAAVLAAEPLTPGVLAGGALIVLASFLAAVERPAAH